MPPLLRQPLRELARRRGLAGALQAQEQDDARPFRGGLKSALAVAKQRDHLVADDLDDLLRGREAAEDSLVLAEGAIADPVDKRLDDLEVDVGFEKRQPDLTQGGFDSLRRQTRFSPETLEDVLEPCAERLEHNPANLLYSKRLS